MRIEQFINPKKTNHIFFREFMVDGQNVPEVKEEAWNDLNIEVADKNKTDLLCHQVQFILAKMPKALNLVKAHVENKAEMIRLVKTVNQFDVESAYIPYNFFDATDEERDSWGLKQKLYAMVYNIGIKNLDDWILTVANYVSPNQDNEVKSEDNDAQPNQEYILEVIKLITLLYPDILKKADITETIKRKCHEFRNYLLTEINCLTAMLTVVVRDTKPIEALPIINNWVNFFTENKIEISNEIVGELIASNVRTPNDFKMISRVALIPYLTAPCMRYFRQFYGIVESLPENSIKIKNTYIKLMEENSEKVIEFLRVSSNYEVSLSRDILYKYLLGHNLPYLGLWEGKADRGFVINKNSMIPLKQQALWNYIRFLFSLFGSSDKSFEIYLFRVLGYYSNYEIDESNKDLQLVVPFLMNYLGYFFSDDHDIYEQMIHKLGLKKSQKPNKLSNAFKSLVNNHLVFDGFLNKDIDGIKKALKDTKFPKTGQFKDFAAPQKAIPKAFNLFKLLDLFDEGEFKKIKIGLGIGKPVVSYKITISDIILPIKCSTEFTRFNQKLVQKLNTIKLFKYLEDNKHGHFSSLRHALLKNTLTKDSIAKLFPDDQVIDDFLEQIDSLNLADVDQGLYESIDDLILIVVKAIKDKIPCKAVIGKKIMNSLDILFKDLKEKDLLEKIYSSSDASFNPGSLSELVKIREVDELLFKLKLTRTGIGLTSENLSKWHIKLIKLNLLLEQGIGSDFLLSDLNAAIKLSEAYYDGDFSDELLTRINYYYEQRETNPSKAKIYFRFICGEFGNSQESMIYQLESILAYKALQDAKNIKGFYDFVLSNFYHFKSLIAQGEDNPAVVLFIAAKGDASILEKLRNIKLEQTIKYEYIAQELALKLATSTSFEYLANELDKLMESELTFTQKAVSAESMDFQLGNIDSLNSNKISSKKLNLTKLERKALKYNRKNLLAGEIISLTSAEEYLRNIEFKKVDKPAEVRQSLWLTYSMLLDFQKNHQDKDLLALKNYLTNVNNATDSIEKKVEQLALLGLIAEKTTGRKLNYSQSYALLAKVLYDSMVYVGLPTGSGKTFVLAVGAAYDVLNHKLSIISTPNQVLADEAYENYKNFYLAAGINTEKLKLGTFPDKLQDKLYIGSICDVINMKQQMALHGLSFSENVILSIDEFDQTLMDSNTKYSISTEQPTDEQLIKSIVRANKIPEQEYLRDPFKVYRAKTENQDYVVRNGKIMPIIDHLVNPAARLDNYVQQFLEAKHELKITPLAKLLIEDDFASLKAACCGCYGVSGTPAETDNELQLLDQPCIMLPAMQHSKRIDHPAEYFDEHKPANNNDKTSKTKDERLLELLKTHEDQSIFIYVKDAESAQILYDKLYSDVNITSANLHIDSCLLQAKGGQTYKNFSNSNTKEIRASMKEKGITILTPKDARGMDIEVAHQDGAVAILLDKMTKKNTKQIKGRVARKGCPGHFYELYENLQPTPDEINAAKRQSELNLGRAKNNARVPLISQIKSLFASKAEYEHSLQSLQMPEYVADPDVEQKTLDECKIKVLNKIELLKKSKCLVDNRKVLARAKAFWVKNKRRNDRKNLANELSGITNDNLCANSNRLQLALKEFKDSFSDDFQSTIESALSLLNALNNSDREYHQALSTKNAYNAAMADYNHARDTLLENIKTVQKEITSKQAEFATLDIVKAPIAVTHKIAKMPNIAHTKAEIAYSSNAFRLWCYGIILAVLMLAASIVSAVGYLKPAFAKKLGLKIDINTLVIVLATALLAFGSYLIFVKGNYKFEYERKPAVLKKLDDCSNIDKEKEPNNKKM